MRFMQVLAKSAVAYAVAQEVLRFSRTVALQMRVATGNTVLSGIHIPEGTAIWLCPQQVCTLFNLIERSRSPCAATCMHNLSPVDKHRVHAPHYAKSVMCMRSNDSTLPQNLSLAIA
jgi:hypothetical protein